MGEFTRSVSDNQPANCCRECHFLAKVKDPKHGDSIAESWSEEERQYPWLTDELDDAVDLHMWRFVWIPICNKGIWKLDSLSDDLTDDEEFAGRKELEDKLTVDRADNGV